MTYSFPYCNVRSYFTLTSHMQHILFIFFNIWHPIHTCLDALFETDQQLDIRLESDPRTASTVFPVKTHRNVSLSTYFKRGISHVPNLTKWAKPLKFVCFRFSTYMWDATFELRKAWFSSQVRFDPKMWTSEEHGSGHYVNYLSGLTIETGCSLPDKYNTINFYCWITKQWYRWFKLAGFCK